MIIRLLTSLYISKQPEKFGSDRSHAVSSSSPSTSASAYEPSIFILLLMFPSVPTLAWTAAALPESLWQSLKSDYHSGDQITSVQLIKVRIFASIYSSGSGSTRINWDLRFHFNFKKSHIEAQSLKQPLTLTLTENRYNDQGYSTIGWRCA